MKKISSYINLALLSGLFQDDKIFDLPKNDIKFNFKKYKCLNCGKTIENNEEVFYCSEKCRNNAKNKQK